MSNGETVVVELSPEEKAVIAVMRQKQRNGRGIFNYAMRFDDDVQIDPNAAPWRQRRSIYG